MNKKGYFHWDVLLLIALIIAIIGGFIGCYNTAKECYEKQNFEETYDLVTLMDSEVKGQSSSFGGGFFLYIGAIGSSSEPSSTYYLKYAYEDQYGIKLMTDKITNYSKIRIKETTNGKARMIKYYRYGFTIRDCECFEYMKVFEVPKGSILKTINIDFE